ncbi:YggT family protein [Alkalibacter saccharofermentans]|uniref:YggT family protein n=1 Tax=Alkalibacter saccharofermentans DSM 14828 TaxID=1120975 RepID=A0A1M4S4R6_9FIRM|nr:YggT family protein [Alkalibacter saccharofermentans]SHE27150.1 YggT family protein [Alkalibacter saccharofermentans DSM 14828]
MSGTLIRVGNAFFEFVNIMIIVNVVLKFISPKKKGKFGEFVGNMTEPMLDPLRRFAMFETMDFSPFIVILLIEYVVLPVYSALVIKLLG